MKTIRVIGMALFAVLLSVGLASCSEDEPSANGEVKLVEANMEVISKYGVSAKKWRISYDSEGKVSLVQRIDVEDGDCDDFNFVWTPNAVVDMRKDIEYIIENGLVRRIMWQGNMVPLEYNTAGHLTSYDYKTYDFNYEKSFTWDGDKLIEYGRSDSSSKRRISYGNQTCKGYFPLIAFPELVIVDDDQHLFLTNPELVGMKTNQLPVKAVDGDTTEEYAYTFTNGGYIKTCTITEKWDGHVKKTTWTFDWK